MEIQFDVQNTLAEGLKKLSWATPEQLAKIASHSINTTMVTVRAREKREMEAKFDRPTPFTLNGFFTRPAKPLSLVAEIRLKDFAGKGTPAAKYLAPEVYGGQRTEKKSEKLLRSAGILPSGYYIAPAKGLKLDAYGNIPRAYIVQVISYLKAFGEVGYTANRNASAKRQRAKRKFYFVNGNTSHDQRGLPWGIYENFPNGHSAMRIAFVKQPSYTKRLDFFGVAQKTVAQFLPSDIARIAAEAQRKGNANTLTGTLTAIAQLMRNI